MSPCSLWMDCWSSCWLPLDGTLSWYIAWSAAKTHSLTTSNSFSEPLRSDDQFNWGPFLCNSWSTCPACTSRWFFTGVQKDLDRFLSSPSKAIWALKIGKCSPNCHEKIGIYSLKTTAQKAARKLKQTHLKPLSEIFLSEQLDQNLVDNKVRENYFGEMTIQLRKKGGTCFKAVGERLVLSSSADLAFS